VLNYFDKYNNAALKPFLDSGKLKIGELPMGENSAQTHISDDRNDVQNSVFSPQAAKERKVDLIIEKIEK